MPKTLRRKSQRALPRESHKEPLRKVTATRANAQLRSILSTDVETTLSVGEEWERRKIKPGRCDRRRQTSSRAAGVIRCPLLCAMFHTFLLHNSSYDELRDSWLRLQYVGCPNLACRALQPCIHYYQTRLTWRCAFIRAPIFGSRRHLEHVEDPGHYCFGSCKVFF